MNPLQCLLTAGKSLVLLISTMLMMALAPCAYGQQEVNDYDQEQTEDQLIAESLWAMVQADAGSVEFDDARQALDVAQEAFPNSARVAYWRGKCGLLQANMTRTLQQLVEVAGSLSEPELESSTDDPVTKRKSRVARPFVEQIRQRIQKRLENSGNADAHADAELAFLQAAQLDPTLTAAWVGLLESSDTSVAVSAAEGWAEIEPDNALPLYAKAVVLTRGHLRFRTLVDKKAIEAIEKGNQRPDCIAPDLPWPTDFHLTFSQAWDEEVPGIAGKQVPEPLLRVAVERLFFQSEAIGNWSTISSSALRDLGDAILSTSHQLPLEQDIRQLRGFVGCAIHLADSNRLTYALTMGAVKRHLNRLETIAVHQQDFESARAFQSIQKHLLETRRAVAKDYQANNQKSGPEQESKIDTLLNIELPQDEENATRVMQSREDPPGVPEIVITVTDRSDGVIVGTDASLKDLDMLRLDLVFSEDRHVHTHQLGGQFGVWFRDKLQQPPTSTEEPTPRTLASEELTNLGLPRLTEQIADIRRSNRIQERSLGLFLVLSDPIVAHDVDSECYASGYIGKRDPCILAFDNAEDLEAFREHRTVAPRLVQMLGSGELLTEEDLQQVTPHADAIAIPVDRLIGSDGKLTSVIQTSSVRFYAVMAKDLDRQRREILTNSEWVIGLLLSQDQRAVTESKSR